MINNTNSNITTTHLMCLGCTRLCQQQGGKVSRCLTVTLVLGHMITQGVDARAFPQ
jgi:hypothetical protein